MPLTAADLLTIGPILFAASVLQATVGFAAGLFGIPLLLLVGMSLPQAITVSLVATLFQSATGVLRLRTDIEFSMTLLPLVIRFFTLPVGIGVLWLASALDSQQVKQLIGVILLLILLVQWLWRVEPREQLHPGWQWLAFSTSGFLAGFCGMGGPPMVLWVMAHRWSPARSRGFLFVMFAVGAPLQLALLAAAFGQEAISAMMLGLLAIFFTLVGTVVGLRLGGMIPKHRLRQASLALLVMIAASAIINPLLKASHTAEVDAPRPEQASQH